MLRVVSRSWCLVNASADEAATAITSIAAHHGSGAISRWCRVGGWGSICGWCCVRHSWRRVRGSRCSHCRHWCGHCLDGLHWLLNLDGLHWLLYNLHLLHRLLDGLNLLHDSPWHLGCHLLLDSLRNHLLNLLLNPLHDCFWDHGGDLF